MESKPHAKPLLQWYILCHFSIHFENNLTLILRTLIQTMYELNLLFLNVLLFLLTPRKIYLYISLLVPAQQAGLLD